MDDLNNSAPFTTLEPNEKKQSGLGTASLIIGIVSILGICLVFGLSFYARGVPPQTAATLTSIVGLGGICSLALGLVGTGLGLAGVIQKASSKTLAIIGVILSAVAFLIMCGIMLLGVAVLNCF